MSCAFDKEKLTAFFDGELAAAEKAEVERHIAACSECLRELGELKAAVTLVKTLPAVRAPRAIAEAVQRAVRPRARVHRWAQPMMWVSAAAAALFVVVNVVWLSQMETPSPVAADKRSDAPAIAAVSPNSDDKRRSASNSSAAPEPAVRRAREAENAEKAAAKEELAKADGAADRKAAEIPAPARKLPAEAPKPAAATAAKPETAPAAPAAPPPGAEAKRDEAPFAQKLLEEQKNRQETAQSVYLATGTNSLACQVMVEGWSARNNLQLRGQAQSRTGQGLAAGGGGMKSPKGVAGKDAFVPPDPMVVEVTEEELAALTKELAANGYRVAAATPAQNKLGYVDLPADKAAADAEKKKEGEADRALKAAAPVEGGPVAKQQAGRAGTRRITIYFVDQPSPPPPAAEKK